MISVESYGHYFSRILSLIKMESTAGKAVSNDYCVSKRSSNGSFDQSD